MSGRSLAPGFMPLPSNKGMEGGKRPRKTPGALPGFKAAMHLRPREDLPISPGSKTPDVQDYFSMPATRTPDLTSVANPFDFHNREYSVAQPSTNVPVISKQPPSAPLADVAPWETQPGPMPMTAQFPPRNNFPDASDSFFKRPKSGKDEPMNGGTWFIDDRRESMASSASSNDPFSRSKKNSLSRPSDGLGSRKESDSGTIIPPSGKNKDLPAAPGNSGISPGSALRSRFFSSSAQPRPTTPSKEVAPFMFPDGQASPMETSTGKQLPSNNSSVPKLQMPSSAKNLGKLTIHRSKASKEDQQDDSPIHPRSAMFPPRSATNASFLQAPWSAKEPPAQRDPSPSGIRRRPPDPLALRTPPTSAAGFSPFPGSAGDGFPGIGDTTPQTGKRSLFDKIRHPRKDKHKGDALRNGSMASTTNLVPPTSAQEYKHFELERAPTKIREDSAALTIPSPNRDDHPGSDGKKGGMLPRRLLGNRTRTNASKTSVSSDLNTNLWDLDTDLSNMNGILGGPASANSPNGFPSATYPGPTSVPRDFADPNSGLGQAQWQTPESWAYKKVGEQVTDQFRDNIPTQEMPKAEDDGMTYCIRIFRIDSTFATLPSGINTTAAEVLSLLGRKSFLQDELNNYQLVMKKNDLQRPLLPGERPFLIQRQMLEEAGYTSTDKIWEIGREDHSYLVRFTFVPTKLGGAYSQDRDFGLSKLSKFSNVDLSSKGLAAIPIALYRKVADIVNLNLSRNLGLDVPSDFLQSCTKLREIKFTGNEVTQVPHSFLLASKLGFLDLTHNNIEELDHIDLGTLKSLVVLKMANNRLKELPAYFGTLESLRTANFASNKLTSIRPNLSGLLNLTEIDLGHNEIDTLDALGELVNLEKLWLASNKISRIPETFMNLLKLRHLDLQRNRLSSIGVLGQLPELENLSLGHNSFTSFSGSFGKLRALMLNDNPLTKFEIQDNLPSLSTLSLSGGKLAGLDEKFYERLTGLTRLDLDRNHLKSFSNGLGKLTKLQTFSFIGNKVGLLPPTIGYLQELRTLDARECSIRELPAEIWYCAHLTTLNVSSNLLTGFPKFSASAQIPLQALSTVSSTSTLASSIPPTIFEDGASRSNGLTGRRPSQPPSNLLAMGTSPASATRQGSMVSVHGPGGRKVSVIPRGSPIEGNSPISRKDSSMNVSRYSGTIAESMRHLFLGDNDITDDVFDVISHLSELRILNLSYNALNEIPNSAFRKWQHLHELYLAGNELTSLPNDDIPELANLKALYLNSNKFQTLPPELAKLPKLVILDVSSNVLKYNVSNWPYDWNWNWNQNLRYLNFSYNRRLEIKPDPNFLGSQRSHADLTNFNALAHLRVLGLMDVTMTIKSVPEENENRRVRTTPSIINSMKYGMADSLGRQEYLSIFDLAIPSFRSQEGETLFAMFDGSALPNRGSRIAKFLQESFGRYLSHEMATLSAGENPSDALRRTFLALNKDFATFAAETADEKAKHISASLHKSTLIALTTAEDLEKGSSAAALYFVGNKLYVANVGDVEVALLSSNGTGRLLSRKHVPSDLEEAQRIRASGGYINRHDRVNAIADVTRAFGYTHQMPAVHAGPHTTVVSINDSDELVIIASKSFWEFMSLSLAFDVARSERDDVMRAAQKLRDLAMSYGAQNKMMVMVVSVANLLKKSRPRQMQGSPNLSQLGSYDDTTLTTRRRGKRGEAVLDAGLNRLDREVDAPVGELAMVFTDIKSSTALWESAPTAMRSAVLLHNELFRRQLRLVGGYEVKTEGDAFMVAFPTATSALLWCFQAQQALIDAPWPQEILETSIGQEIRDDDDVVIYRGLSVRMGIHWGECVCDLDIITKRMDYFGPMVNRASRISGIADGGEISCSRDFSNELARLLNTFQESDRSGSTSSAETMMDDAMVRSIKRELSTLSALGFEIKDIGEVKLKGLENPEMISLICSQPLLGRLVARERRIEQGQVPSEVPVVSRKRGISLAVDETQIWALYNLVERLESLCATLEFKEPKSIRSATNPLAAKVRDLVYEVDNDLACQVLENFVTRAETCISTLTMRFMVRPLVPGRGLMEQAGPMSEIFSELSSQLGELKMLRAAVMRDGDGDD